MHTIAVRPLGRGLVPTARVLGPQGRVLFVGRRGFFWSKQNAKDQVPKNKLRPNRSTTVALAVLGLGAYGTYHSVQVVESGHVGVVEILGVVQDDLLTSGLHLVLPWAKVTKISTRQRSVLVETHTRIRGGLFVEMKLRVMYKYKSDPDTIKEIYATGKEFHVQAVAKSVLHSVAAKKTMEQMHDTHQVEICGEIRDGLNKIYKTEGIFVQSVVLEQVHLPDYLVSAIQDLHKLDLEISQDKRMVDGQLAVARGTAAARSTIKGEDPMKSAFSKSMGKPPIMYKRGLDDIKKKNANPPKTTSVKDTEPGDSTASSDDNEEEISKARNLFDKLFLLLTSKGDNSKSKGDDNDTKKEKKLPTLSGYVRQVKDERKILSSFLPSLAKKDKEAEQPAGTSKKEAAPSSAKKEKEAEQSAVPSKEEPAAKLPKKEDAPLVSKVIPHKKNEKEDVALPQANAKVEEAKLPPLKAKPEPASLNGGTEPSLEEAAPKAKAAGEAEKE